MYMEIKTKLGTCKHTYYSTLPWKRAGLSLDTHTCTHSHGAHDLRLSNAQSLSSVLWSHSRLPREEPVASVGPGGA